MISYIFLIVGLVLLVKGADWLVSGASVLARRFGLSDLTIGLTVVAFGTSMPELTVSLTAALGGNGGIAMGNVLGSNIANILLILGISALVLPLGVASRTVKIEIPLCLVMALLVAALGILGAGWNRLDGLILLAVFVGFLIYVWHAARQPGANAPEAAPPARQWGIGRSLLVIAAGLAGLIVGGRGVVMGAVDIARTWGVSESVIGLTLVAVGTSLPELATSIMAARQKNTDIAIGNVVGSNIFNIGLILGTTIAVKPIPYVASYAVDLGLVVLAVLFLMAAMYTGRRYLLERWEGSIFLLCYIGYVTHLFIG